MSLLYAGTGRSDITPLPGTPHGGWGAQTHQVADGADMPLYATALVLTQDETTIAIVDADAIGFDAILTAKIVSTIAMKSGIPEDHIRFSCSHTHSGPNTFRLQVISEGLEMIHRYIDQLPGMIASSVCQARENLRPVRIGGGEGCCDINVNRRLKLDDGRMVIGRNWRGPVDRTVRVARIDDLDEKPVATLVNYACHPTIMAWQNRFVTPDYPGVVRRVVEEQTGGVCLFLQGATGNIGPRRGFTGDREVYRRLGTILGLEASRIAIGIETVPRRESVTGVIQSGAVIALYEDRKVETESPRLGFASRTLVLPAKPAPPKEVCERKAAAELAELERLRREGTEEEVRLATARATQAGIVAELARIYEVKTEIEWPLQAIAIGPVALVSTAGEPFVEIGQRIISASPFEFTMVSGYSNGGFGYIPVREAYPEGGYEVESSPFAPDAADIIVREAASLLAAL